MFVDYGDKMMTRLNDLYVATSFSNIPMLAHRFYVPELRAYNKNKQWSDHVLQKCREWLVNETCNIHTRGSLQTKILPCSIGPTTQKHDLISYIKRNQLYYEEGVDEKGDIILSV